jgi:hypothetical protein
MEVVCVLRLPFSRHAGLLIPPELFRHQYVTTVGVHETYYLWITIYFSSRYLLFLSFKNLFSKISYDIIALTIQSTNPNKLFM